MEAAPDIDQNAQPQPRRFLLSALGEPGHAFPIIALGRALHNRGHAVAIHTWDRWREPIEAEGLTFVKAPVFQPQAAATAPVGIHEAGVRAAQEIFDDIDSFAPDIIVGDVLTIGATLAAEVRGIPFATLIPHLYHVTGPEEPMFGSGFAPPATIIGRTFARRFNKGVGWMFAQGRIDMNAARAEVGLAPIDRDHGGLSTELVLVGSFPQLEPQRDLPAHVKIVGPLQWEPPVEQIEIPEGDDPLVVIAPSTSQDPYHSLLDASLRGLANKPLRVLASLNGRPPANPLKTAKNIHVVDWLPYSQAFPLADVVICHGGYGTMVRSLAAGAATIICPINGDQFENAARLRWAHAGVAVPAKFCKPRTLALAVEKALASEQIRANSEAISRWSRANDGAAKAARELEAFAARVC
ncbi:MAG: hypothetical protein JHC87_05885 [Thermoleophilaceae bacterium]|nr:hypothetical protein [Thermoleophilaceae bacterium]